MEIQGKLVQKNQVMTGQGRNGEWKKQEIIIDLADASSSYPRKLCVVVWGDKVNSVATLPEGSLLNLSVDLESREWNGKWYTDVKAWKIDLQNGSSAPVTPSASSAPQSYDIPSPPPAPAGDFPSATDYPPIASGQPDDLPF